MKRVVISDRCASSGICVAVSALLEELPNGKARPKDPGTITDAESAKFQEVIRACPSGAISLVDCGLVKSKGKAGIAELKKVAQEKLSNTGIQKPSSSNYRLSRSEYSMPYVSASGEHRYDYKSFDAAERAGLREFDRVMYSQRRALVQQILVEWKHRKLMPYNHYEETDGNFYYETIRAIERSLGEIVNEAKELTEGKIRLPEGFERFSPKINFTDNGSIPIYQLRYPERVITDTIVNRLESLGSFQSYVNTPDMDIDDDHYKVAYDLNEVIREFGRDLLNEIENDANDWVVDTMEMAVNEFRNAVQQELKSKLDVLGRALDQA